jgi:hypothetical protein
MQRHIERGKKLVDVLADVEGSLQCGHTRARVGEGVQGATCEKLVKVGMAVEEEELQPR